MPALPFVPGVVRINMGYAMPNGKPAQNVLHWTYTGTLNANTQCAAIAGQISSIWGTTLGPQTWNGISLTSVVVTALDSATAPFGEWTGSVAAGHAGSEPANGTSVLVNYAQATKYRGGKPRTYFPPGSDDQIGAGVWGPVYLANFQTALSNFELGINGYVAGAATMGSQCAVSYYKGYNPPTTLPSGKVKQTAKINPAGPVVRIFTGSSVNPIPGSQRRRNGHGR